MTSYEGVENNKKFRILVGVSDKLIMVALTCMGHKLEFTQLPLKSTGTK